MPQKPIKAPSTTAENSDQRMNIDQLKAYHPDCPARSTIYDRVCQNRIPVHEDGKKLRFLRSEIDQWLSGGRIKTKDEIGNQLKLIGYGAP